jgi:glyoxylase-like metal-dependent hydrolase (beta-lactamase superfamily II)
VLLTGDAAWTEKSWRWPARPISAGDMSRWVEQAWRIHKFAMLEPRLVVVPGHDDMAVAQIGIASFIAHDLPGAAKAAPAATAPAAAT